MNLQIEDAASVSELSPIRLFPSFHLPSFLTSDAEDIFGTTPTLILVAEPRKRPRKRSDGVDRSVPAQVLSPVVSAVGSEWHQERSYSTMNMENQPE